MILDEPIQLHYQVFPVAWKVYHLAPKIQPQKQIENLLVDRGLGSSSWKYPSTWINFYLTSRILYTVANRIAEIEDFKSKIGLRTLSSLSHKASNSRK